MQISWKFLISDCKKLSNCKIVCADSQVTETHKIVLGSVSQFLKSIISEIPTGDDITFFLPDFDCESVEEFLGAITLNETPSNTELQAALGKGQTKTTYRQQTLSHSQINLHV